MQSNAELGMPPSSGLDVLDLCARMPKFFGPGDAPDPLYTACREHGSKRSVKRRIERMWTAYEPYCPDQHFLRDARSHFVARTWEMYVAVSLLRSGHQLSKPPGHGPDLRTSIGGAPFWVEAVAALPGTGPDKVAGRKDRGRHDGNVWLGHAPSEESLLLRIAGAVGEKHRKVREYESAGVTCSAEPFVIAVTLGGIVDADVSSPLLPLAVKFAFGIGTFGYTIVIDGPPEGSGFLPRSHVKKHSGASVRTASFCSPETCEISGLLFTTCGIFNAPRRAGSDMVFVHNPCARAPVPRGTFRFVKNEFWLTDAGVLERHRRRSA
jgi:hypothetical protein